MTKSSGATSVGVTSQPGGAPLPWLLRRVNHRYRAAVRDRLAECGFGEIPQPGYWAIMVLAGGGTDAGHLMHEMGVSKQAVSKLVEALVAAGVVVRRPNGSDRRRSDLSLTTKGREAARVIADALRQTEQTFVAELGVVAFKDLIQMLAQLARRDN